MDPHGVVRAQHGDGRAEVDALGATRDRGEHDLGRRDRELVPVVLADAEEIQTEPVGQFRLRDDVAQHLRLRERFAVRAEGHVAERVQSELESARHPPPPSIRSMRPHPRCWNRTLTETIPPGAARRGECPERCARS
ncbi:hypothetical protein GCM10025870_28190 [Agromyces marinus]|uniref:Uncharacterized protein n=1 Tax=Agromyces marinus TaxID=1389020 RepID=A0ABN6YF67_9MICO|nr:hypothetical protein GCM10025870_28190 [Agromyces marinus]